VAGIEPLIALGREHPGLTERFAAAPTAIRPRSRRTG
jgi:hypothetical protein